MSTSQPESSIAVRDGRQITDPIAKFVKWYKKEHDSYNSLALATKDLFDQKFCQKPRGQFAIAPVKCILQARAKSTIDLDKAVRRRENDRVLKAIKEEEEKQKRGEANRIGEEDLGRYQNIEQIKDDMPDLAGIRVILAFPDDDVKVDGFINTVTTIKTDLNYPKYWGVNKDGTIRTEQFSGLSHANRFVGYRAIHYRVKLEKTFWDDSVLANPIDDNDSLKVWWERKWDSRWQTKDVEIQVTSMLMYAWQEVHHDLAYKTYQGKLTPDEMTSLDMVNGLVHANEIALNQFHQSLNKRLLAQRTPFRDVSQMNDWIVNHVTTTLNPRYQKRGPSMAYAEPLLKILQEYGLDTPERLVELLSSDPKGRYDGVAVKQPWPYSHALSAFTEDLESIDAAIRYTEYAHRLMEVRLVDDFVYMDERSLKSSYGPDATVWVLLAVCSKHSPFLPKTDDELQNVYGGSVPDDFFGPNGAQCREKNNKKFIALAFAALSAFTYKKGDKDTLEFRLLISNMSAVVAEGSELDRLMIWSGQRSQSDRNVETAADVLEQTDPWELLSKAVVQSKPHSTYEFHDSVNLAMALLAFSYIPSASGPYATPSWAEWSTWRENRAQLIKSGTNIKQHSVFWPGLVGTKERLEPLVRFGSSQRSSDMPDSMLLMIVDNNWVCCELPPGNWVAKWTLMKTDIPIFSYGALDVEDGPKVYSQMFLAEYHGYKPKIPSSSMPWVSGWS